MADDAEATGLAYVRDDVSLYPPANNLKSER